MEQLLVVLSGAVWLGLCQIGAGYLTNWTLYTSQVQSTLLPYLGPPCTPHLGPPAAKSSLFVTTAVYNSYVYLKDGPQVNAAIYNTAMKATAVMNSDDLAAGGPK